MVQKNLHHRFFYMSIQLKLPEAGIKKAVPKDSLSIEFKIVRMIIFQQPILLHPVLSAWQ